MNRRCRTGQIVDSINLKFEGIDHIMTHELKTDIIEQMLDVLLTASEKIIQADDLAVLLNQTIAQMASKETGSTHNQYTLPIHCLRSFGLGQTYQISNH